MAQALLEAEGISASISDEYSSTELDWRVSGGGLGGVHLEVAPERAEAAVALLVQGTSFDGAELDRLTASDDPIGDGDLCPSCGSLSIGPAPLSRGCRALTMLPFLLFLLWPFFAASRRRQRCSSCGHTWRPGT